jgi:hypothetical protein
MVRGVIIERREGDPVDTASTTPVPDATGGATTGTVS